MKAAVVRSFDRFPRYEDFDLAAPSGEEEIVVEVLAAGLHPRVRSSASGTHYSEVPVLPMIPGIDAVGRLPDGRLVYCVVHDSQFGTMADSVVVDRRRCVPLPSDVDGVAVAAAMNPAMSSWMSTETISVVPQWGNQSRPSRQRGDSPIASPSSRTRASMFVWVMLISFHRLYERRLPRPSRARRRDGAVRQQTVPGDPS